MKFIITESRIDQIIVNYLDENFIPNYGWATIDYYRSQVAKWNNYNFLIEDDEAYAYYREYDGNQNVLAVNDWLTDKLTALFGNKWPPVFRQWFEEATSLKVKTFLYEREHFINNDNGTSFS